MNKSRFKLTKDPSLTQTYHFVLKAPNNKAILNSENYTTKDSALNGIASIKVNSLSKDNFKIKTAENNEKYFVLKAQIDAVMEYALNSETEK